MNIEKRNCQNCKNDFVIDSDDFGFYEKIKVPRGVVVYSGDMVGATVGIAG